MLAAVNTCVKVQSQATRHSYRRKMVQMHASLFDYGIMAISELSVSLSLRPALPTNAGGVYALSCRLILALRQHHLRCMLAALHIDAYGSAHANYRLVKPQTLLSAQHNVVRHRCSETALHLATKTGKMLTSQQASLLPALTSPYLTHRSCDVW